MNAANFNSHPLRIEGRLELAFDPDRLRRLRIKRKFTQQQIADLLRIPRQNYQNYEKPKDKGGYAPKGMRTQRLAELLETTPEYLTGQTDDPARPITMNDLDANERKLLAAYRRGDLQAVNQLFLDKARKNQGK